MKLNKWTVGLAAVGLVSMASVARAEEKESMLQTALSSTTLSGYVDTSAQWNFGTGNANLPPYKFGGASKADGFNLNVIQLRIERPLDEAEWAAGYRVDLWAGPDANTLDTLSSTSTGYAADFAIRQAYIALRMPVGNGIDWKLGVFDSIIGYESVEDPSNPNYTRSYGHSLEPQTHTGILASYRLSDALSVSAGIANTTGSSINSRAQDGSADTITGGPFAPALAKAGIFAASDVTGTTIAGSNPRSESYKAYMGSVALTAPDNMSFLSGSTIYAGIVHGYNNSVFGLGVGDVSDNYYLGATLATPVAGLRVGFAFDYLDLGRATFDSENSFDANAWSVAGYASFQATEKLSFHARLEYLKTELSGIIGDEPFTSNQKILAATATAQYDLWKNVLTRVEFRWDHSLSGDDLFGGNTFGEPDMKNAFMLAANVIYKF